jgi:photosystem II stability/assembly factor-like uncharacterized protein
MKSVSLLSKHGAKDAIVRPFLRSALLGLALSMAGFAAGILPIAKASAAPTTEGWKFRDTLGISVPFNGLAFVSPTEGWVTGASGVILHTTDAGKHWYAQTSGTSHWLQSVSFPDATHGWVVGNDGTILATRDGGESWTSQDSGVKFDLFVVTFLDDKEGWAGGFAGTLLHTSNGGKTWTKVSTGTAQWIMNIFFLKSDPKFGWAVGQDGLVLVTKDGGETWQKKNNSVGKDLYGVYFIDQNQGWAVGTHGIIQYTANGGDSWIIQNGLGRGPMGRAIEGNERELNDLHAIVFLDNKTGYAVGVMGYVLKTVDAGNTWSIIKPGTGLDLYNISFPGPDSGWIVGVGGMILYKGKS